MTVTRGPRRARWPWAIGLVVVGAAGLVTAGSAPAAAYWPGAGSGTGLAFVGTLGAPTTSVSSPVGTSTAAVTWTAPAVPSGASVSGYFVVRFSGSTGTAACGSGPTTLLPAAPRSCTDTAVPAGTYTYRVTAVLGSWTAESAASPSVTVSPDTTPPTMTLAGTGATNTSLSLFSGAYRVYYRSNAVGGGSISMDAAVTDSGIGPASATFPAIATTGWTHNAETVTTGSGSAPTITYTSTAFTFTQMPTLPTAKSVVGRDIVGNTVTISPTFVSDTTAPGGGALSVNGTTATSGGAVSKNATGSVTVGTLTQYTEALSATAAGLATSGLTRAFAPLSNGVCGAFGAATPIVGAAPITQTGLANGCYAYVLTGRDQVGNSAALTTTVWVDTTPPVGGAISANGTAASAVETTSTSATGAWPLTRTDYTDPESGATSTLVRTRTTYANGVCGGAPSASTLTAAPTQSGLGTFCYQYRLTGTNGVSTSAIISTLVKSDTSAPAGGALTVNGSAATPGAGPSSNSTSGTYPISIATAYTDANSGVVNQLTRTPAALVGNACQSFVLGTETTLPVATATESGMSTGCYRYTLTGTNGVGTAVAITTTVKVDTSVPQGGAVSANGVTATTGGATAGSTDASVSLSRTDYTDPDSGMTSSTLRRDANALSNGLCSGTVTTTVLTGTPGQTALTTGCYRYYLTGINALGATAVISVTVLADSSGPTGGALTVNGAVASPAGSTSTSTSGSFAISTLVGYADAQSGAASTLTRTSVPIAGGVCGDFATGTDTVISGSAPIAQSDLPSGCYRYVLRGINGAGAAATLTTTVQVDTTAPAGGQLRANSVDATPAGSTSWSATGAFALDRVDFADPETAATSILTRESASMSDGTCGTFGSTGVVGGAPAQALADGCHRFVLTGTNALGLASTLTTTVKADSTAPTGAVLTVNGVNATAAGSASSGTGINAITAATPFADAQSGMSENLLIRSFAPLDGPGCGAFDAGSSLAIATATDAAPGPGCYRYTLSGVNRAGTPAAVFTTVRLTP